MGILESQPPADNRYKALIYTVMRDSRPGEYRVTRALTDNTGLFDKAVDMVRDLEQCGLISIRDDRVLPDGTPSVLFEKLA